MTMHDFIVAMITVGIMAASGLIGYTIVFYLVTGEAWWK